MSQSNARESSPALSVIVPVWNEAGNITPLVTEIAATLQGHDFEIIYVNDGSRDATDEELRSLMMERPWLRQIRHVECCGKSAAVRTGVIMARASVIVTVDGDCQNDPAFILPLIAALDAGTPRVGLVAGQRVRRNSSGFKKWQSRVANSLRAALLRDGTRDTACGLKAFRRDVFMSLPIFDGLHRFLPALVKREGFDVAYVDVVDRPRQRGVSKYGMWDRLWVGIFDLAGVWWLIRRRKRLPQYKEVTLDR